MAAINAKKHLRNISTGAGIAGVTAEARLHAGDGLVDDATTDAGGMASLDVGYPGPHYTTATYNGRTKIDSSREVGFIGTFSGADLPTAFRVFTDGVIDDYLLELAVSSGAGLSVNVATGGALVLGHPFENDVTTNVVLDVADPTNPRIDRIVLRLYPIGTANEGKFELDSVTGTPAVTPVAPAVTQSAAIWEISLAQVAVAAGASSPGVITDERVTSTPVTVEAASVVGELDVTSVVAGSVSANTLISLVSASLFDVTISTISGRVVFKSTAPTVQATPSGTFPGAGVSPTAVLSNPASDTAGEVQITRGTGSSSGSLFKLVFGTAKPSSAYSVSLFPRSLNARAASVHCSSKQTTGFTIDIAAGGTGGDQLNWDYQVLECGN